MKLQEVLLALAELSSAQWGLFTTAQGRARGVSRLQLSRLAEAGQLERLANGVYRDTGAPVGEFDAVRAAWLSTDPQRTAAQRLDDGATGAVVGAATAAFLHGVGDLQPEPFVFCVAKRRQSQRPEIRYRQRTLSEDDVTMAQGLPVTTIERTIAELVQEGQDLSLVADVLADAVRSTSIRLDRLSVLLEPLAARTGHRKNDGRALLDHLLKLGGVDAATQLQRVVANPVWGDYLAFAPAFANLAESITGSSRNLRLAAPDTTKTFGNSTVSRQMQETIAATMPDMSSLANQSDSVKMMQDLASAAITPALKAKLAAISSLNLNIRTLDQLGRLQAASHQRDAENE